MSISNRDAALERFHKMMADKKAEEKREADKAKNKREAREIFNKAKGPNVIISGAPGLIINGVPGMIIGSGLPLTHVIPVTGGGVGFIGPGGITVIGNSHPSITISPHTGRGPKIMVPGMPGFWVAHP